MERNDNSVPPATTYPAKCVFVGLRDTGLESSFISYRIIDSHSLSCELWLVELVVASGSVGASMNSTNTK